MLRILNQGIGIEVEVEQFPNAIIPMDVTVKWELKNDGSLRNNGKEFITRFGCRVWSSFDSLDTLFNYFQAIRQDVEFNALEFNERTSIHVHFDIRNMTLEEIKSLLVLYVIFEDSLFRFAGEHRKHNVFCVPVRYIAMSELGQLVMTVMERWKKYSALNFSRAFDIGTVEFRQMEGNDNVERIKTWIMILSHLMNYCRSTPYKHIEEEVRKLKYISHYQEFMGRVFGVFSECLEIVPEEFDAAVSDSKLFFSLKESY